jgi:hypothetical protein
MKKRNDFMQILIAARTAETTIGTLSSSTSAGGSAQRRPTTRWPASVAQNIVAI